MTVSNLSPAKQFLRSAGLVLAFVVLASLVISLLSLDFRPKPLYHAMRRDTKDPYFAVTVDTPVSIEFTPSKPEIESISFPVSLPHPRQPLFVAVRDKRRDELIKQVRFNRPGTAFVDLSGQSLDGASIAVEFSSRTEDPRKAPKISWARRKPYYPVKVAMAGKAISRYPLLHIEYAWPSRMALLIWLLVIPGFVFASQNRKRVTIFLVLLGLCCTVTSTLLWQQNYSVVHFGHWDADRYGMYAEKIANFITRPETREATRGWFRDYPHLHNALAPTIMSMPIALGVRRDIVYSVFSAICGFLSLLLLFRILGRRLGLSYRTSLIAVALSGCHLLHLRAFSRPVNDELGLVLTIWMLDLLLSRIQETKPLQTAALALLLVLHPLARPQGLAYIPFIVAAVIFCDWWRTRLLDPKIIAITVAKLMIAPMTVLAILYFSFDWLENLGLSLAKAKHFLQYFRFRFFYSSMAGLCQVLPFIWLFVKRQRIRSPGFLVLLGWSVFYVAILIAVRAPFWMRHFMPLLPVVVCLTALGLEDAKNRSKIVIVSLTILLCLANVAVIVYQIGLSTRIPPEIEHFISSG